MRKSTVFRLLSFFSLFYLLAPVSVAQTVTTRTYIEKLPGWQSCSVCSGAQGAGNGIPYWMIQNVASPTMGAKSAEFVVAGTTPYGSALWWEGLGANPNAHNFVYDAYFYMTSPASSQALEFDVNQAAGGFKYIFGTQCNIVMHTFDVWGGTMHWQPTGIPCTQPVAYQWNHITLELQRTSTNQALFVSMTLNGVKTYINKSYAPVPSNTQILNVAFQMDGRKVMVPYQTWMENLSLKYW